jgi:hypothetical protein
MIAEPENLRTPGNYFAFGLHLRSALPLPEVSTLPAGGDAPSVDIRLGNAGEMPAARYRDAVSEIGADDYLLTIKDVARYRVRNGREIVVDPCSEASDRNVRGFLLGTAIGALCHQRGLLPLHASTIELDGRAIAFAGASGAGKSTLAAFFHSRGYQVLGDDVCVVSFDNRGRPVVRPGLARLKLWRDAAAALGHRVEGLAIDVDSLEKYQFSTGTRRGTDPLPLERLYVLDQACRPADIRRLSGTDAAAALIDNTYRRFLLAPMGHASAYLAQIASLLRQIGVYAVSRQRRFDLLAAEAEALELHFLRKEWNFDDSHAHPRVREI